MPEFKTIFRRMGMPLVRMNSTCFISEYIPLCMHVSMHLTVSSHHCYYYFTPSMLQLSKPFFSRQGQFLFHIPSTLFLLFQSAYFFLPKFNTRIRIERRDGRRGGRISYYILTITSMPSPSPPLLLLLRISFLFPRGVRTRSTVTA